MKVLAPVAIQSLTPCTAVTRHISHSSMGAHTPYAQPQYYNTNGYHCPSPNPPPYTEYATELNRPQSLRHPEGESSYWTAIGGDTSRYLGGQSNRQVLPPTSSIIDYMRPHYLASIKNIITMCNIRLITPTHPTHLASPSFPRIYPPFPIRHHLPRVSTPRPLRSPLHLTSVLFLKRGSTLSRSPQLFSIIL